MRACDTCRVRKIRCDRSQPCSSCVSSGFECSTTPRASRGPRTSISKSLKSIKPKTSEGQSALQPQPGSTPTSSSPALQAQTDRAHISSELSELPDISLVDRTNVDLQHDSGLDNDSAAARDLLVHTLANNSGLRDHPRMRAAIAALRQTVEADKKSIPQKTPNLAGSSEGPVDLYAVKLPPVDIVLELLRRSKAKDLYIFSGPLSYITRDGFTDLCRMVFFRTDNYGATTAILVHGTLDILFQDFKWQAKEPSLRQQYNEWAQLCRRNLETSCSHLNLLVPACLQSAQALLVAASYYMSTAQASLCKKLTTHGCSMVLSLGWHRKASQHDDEAGTQRQKLVIFWMFYVLDRGLTIRLGQSGLIQNDDIELPLPWMSESALLPELSRIKIWVLVNRLLDLVYRRLYSPAALKRSAAERFEAVQDLLTQAQKIKPSSVMERRSSAAEANSFLGALDLTVPEEDAVQSLEGLDTVEHSHRIKVASLVHLSDVIVWYSMLCMIYRATPSSVHASYDPAAECLEAARAALNCHQAATEVCKGEPEMWNMFLHWTMFNTPFVPFTVVFSHVLRTLNRTDLQRLQTFASTMADSPTSKAAYNVSRLASVFVNLAVTYVELKEQETQDLHTASGRQPHPAQEIYGNATTKDQQQLPQPLQQQYLPTPELTMSDWSAFDPFLDALGMTDLDRATSMGQEFGTSTNLDNWLSGQQHIMGLLDDDLSYLDDIEFGP